MNMGLYEGVNHLCTISRCVRNANLRFLSRVLVPEGYASQQMDISALLCKVETKIPHLCCSKFNGKLQQQTLQGAVSFIYRLMDHNFRCVFHSDRSERLITLIHHNVTVVGVLIRSIAQLHLIISTDLALRTSKHPKVGIARTSPVKQTIWGKS